MNIKTQTSKDKVWKDEQGLDVPFKRLTDTEKLKEKHAFAAATAALKIHNSIVVFKQHIKTICEEVFAAVMTVKERKKVTKGNFTWYNFEGSIKIEVSINENLEFDGMLIEKAKQLLMEMVGESINKDKEFIKDMVMSAFQTSKGKLDTKRIMGLKKHAKRIQDNRYHKAMKLIDEASKVTDSKTYFRVWVKDDGGQYQNIDLNFASITV